MSSRAGTRFYMFHASDEVYGSDRMLLQVIDSMPLAWRSCLTVILPISPHGPGMLSSRLMSLNVNVGYRNLPILRRRDIQNLAGIVGLVWNCATLIVWLLRRPPSLVFCSTSATALVMIVVSLTTRAQLIVHLHEVLTGSQGRFLGWAMGVSDKVLCASRAVQHSLPDSVATKSVVVTNGVATTSDPLVPPPKEGPVRYLVASRWTARKGYGTLFAAWNKSGCPGMLFIAGSAPELGAGIDVEGMARALDSPESVKILGQHDSIFSLIDHVDAVVVPSDEPEAFGLVAVEAFSRGRPVVSAAAGGLADVVRDGISGYSFPPRDVDALAEIFRDMTRNSLSELGRLALQEYWNEYSAPAFAGRMAPVWDALVPR